MIVAVYLLTACASNNVVVQPVAFKDVKPELMEKPALTACPKPVKRPSPSGELRYAVGEWQAYGDCKAAQVDDLYARLTGLQRAVGVRQLAAKKAVAASKL
ncbi:hypothetical protein [Hyphomicrobium sp. ghe19]|uniref:hypothetical protein n=1 Tax=Hyphomicrobium sp. ghe19 TaxID=2682968 RepID=UPI0013669252|nr:hypothetical protein HYPP_03753 [Hyphomicrobium sp. ghe19]